jgi:hypothetical protein
MQTKPTMENPYTNAGLEFLNLLRQQRYLYHEMRLLTLRKQELTTENSPELILELISARRKLTEKLRDVNNKLRIVKTNWHKLLSQIGPQQMSQANELTEHIKQLVTDIQTAKTKGAAAQSTVQEGPKSDKFMTEIYS